MIDTGVGIPEQHLGAIFEPFFSTRQDSGGTGVGLAVCHSIVKNYGGSIEVDSQPGKGTTFHIFLPEYPPSMVGESLNVNGRDNVNARKEHVI